MRNMGSVSWDRIFGGHAVHVSQGRVFGGYESCAPEAGGLAKVKFMSLERRNLGDMGFIVPEVRGLEEIWDLGVSKWEG